MGNKQSGFLKKEQDIRRAIKSVAINVTSQFDVDTLQVYLSRKGFSFEEIMEITIGWEAVKNEFIHCLDVKKNVEADVVQEHLDDALREIIKDKMELIPFSKRYPYVDDIKYCR